MSVHTVLDDDGQTILHVSVSDHMNDTDVEFGDYLVEVEPAIQLFTTGKM